MADNRATNTLTNTNDACALRIPTEQATALIQLTGTWTGTVSFKASPDYGTTWYDAYGPPATGGASVHSATGNGAWVVNCAGMTDVEAIFTTASSGNVSALVALAHVDPNVTSINVSGTGLALESGGHLAAIDTVQGTTADAAYTSGSGSVVSILKGIFGRVLAAGQATMANSLPVVIASDQSKLPTNLSQVNGSALSATNGVLTEAMIINLIRSGKGFIAQNGEPATATNTNLSPCAISIFNASNSGKSVYIYSIVVSTNSASVLNRIYATTTDPSGGTGYTGTPVTANTSLGGASPSASVCSSATGISASPSTSGMTKIGTMAVPGNQGFEMIPAGQGFLLPAGAANGIMATIFVSTAGNSFTCTARWVEY